MRFTKPRTQQEMIRDNLIVKHLSGSHAYGTNIEGSDLDIRGVFMADPICVRTPWYTTKEGKIADSEDAKLYEFHEFMKNVVDQGPNIIETLWVDLADCTFSGSPYAFLRSVRQSLLSKRAAFKFTGYGMSQMNRIKGHNKWINNPQPKEPPQQVDFVKLIQWFGESKMMPRDFTLRKFTERDFRIVPYGGNIFGLYGYERNLAAGFSTLGHTPFNLETGALNTQFEGEREYLGPPGAIVKFNEKEYKQAKENHTNYWKWKRDRNPQRSELEEQFGYDTKHAMHLFRLMRMGQEILETGFVLVKRPDAAELLDIRNGKLSYEEIVEYGEHMDDYVRNVAYKQSDLPREVNLHFAANVIGEVQSMMWDKEV